jgi:HPt (histidine-containing phosphotransfer) domain-containing protein
LGSDEAGEILGDIGAELDALTGLLENASSDNAAVARAAHKAAGSMGAAGLVAITSVLRKIESSAKAGDSKETAELVAAIGDMVPPARNELDNLIRDIRSHE